MFDLCIYMIYIGLIKTDRSSSLNSEAESLPKNIFVYFILNILVVTSPDNLPIL